MIFNILQKKSTWIILIILLFAPKISLFQVPGHVQGIRVENLLVFLFFVCAFAKWGFRLKFRFPIFWLFFVWGALSTLVSYIDQNNINFMILIRIFEYGIVCSVTWICVVKYYSNVERALIFYLFVNIIFSLMQKFGLIGGFSSGGFLHAGHDWLGRPYGLLGGPWELAIVSFFISLILIENKNYPIYFKFIIFLILIFIIYITDSRAPFFAIILSGIIVLYNNFSSCFMRYFGLPVMAGLILTIIFTYFEILTHFSSRMSVFFDIISQLRYANIYNLTEILSIDSGLKIRIDYWKSLYHIWITNYYFIFLGFGATGGVYFESGVLRLLFSFGIVGAIALLVIGYRFLGLSAFIFLVISSLTLDSLMSSKIFLIVSLYGFMRNQRMLKMADSSTNRNKF